MPDASAPSPVSFSPLTAEEWRRLIRRVFDPTPKTRRLALLVDLPDSRLSDNERWQRRRQMVWRWRDLLTDALSKEEIAVSLVAYRNARTNNGPLPDTAWVLDSSQTEPVNRAEALHDHPAVPFSDIFRGHQLAIAPTQLSATAPLKLATREFGFQAATMPAFSNAMLPALRLDYEEIDRRCKILKQLLDRAEAAHFQFQVGDDRSALTLDLRHRTAHVSSGLIQTPGMAGNLPSGETYIVPYEGEVEDDPSRTKGRLPVQLGDEVVMYRVEANRAIEVESEGPTSRQEAQRLRDEPAYGNMAELGLGVLSAFGLEPIGEILLDEKLGLHIAFGRSDHFGGQTGVDDFSEPDQVVHIDRVYLPQTQPRVRVLSVDLEGPEGSAALMRDGRYVADVFAIDGAPDAVS